MAVFMNFVFTPNEIYLIRAIYKRRSETERAREIIEERKKTGLSVNQVRKLTYHLSKQQYTAAVIVARECEGSFCYAQNIASLIVFVFFLSLFNLVLFN